MPHKDPEERKAYQKEYYQRTKGERKEYAQTKEEKALYEKEYYQTPAGKKTHKKKISLLKLPLAT